jgi:hypothetical protein
MDLNPTDKSFFSIVPRDPLVLIRDISLPITFGTTENYRTEYVCFIVDDFEIAHDDILGRLSLAKFMVVPHYTYMVLNMPTPNSVLTIKGDTGTGSACERENHHIATTLDLRAAKVMETQPRCP